jgi:hypothetical protein
VTLKRTFNYDEPNFLNVETNRSPNAGTKSALSAFTLACEIPDDVFTTNSTRKKPVLGGESATCAKKKNLNLGACPPDAMHSIECACI